MDKSHFIINPILKFGSQKKKKPKNKIKSIVLLMVTREKVKHQPSHKTLQSTSGPLTRHIVAKDLG